MLTPIKVGSPYPNYTLDNYPGLKVPRSYHWYATGYRDLYYGIWGMRRTKRRLALDMLLDQWHKLNQMYSLFWEMRQALGIRGPRP